MYSILQWNCVARSHNIGYLACHNFKVGEDSIKICYDITKCDQSGEKVNDKYIYANPCNPRVCPYLSLGVWFGLEAKGLGSQINLFGVETMLSDAPSNKYATQLSTIIKGHKEVVSIYT